MFSPDTKYLNHTELEKISLRLLGLAIIKFGYSEASHNQKEPISFYYRMPSLVQGAGILRGANETEKMTKEELKHFITAFRHPHLLDGLMTLWMGKEKVYKVENKQLKDDPLNLGSHFHQQDNIEQMLDTASCQIIGQSTYRDISNLLQSLRSRNKDGSIYHESKHYLFSERSGELKVINKASNLEILNSDGFNSEASKVDVEAMYKLAEGAEALQKDKLNQVLLKNTRKHIQKPKL